MVVRRSLSVALVGLLGLAACNPRCERTCRKLLDCGNLQSDRLAVEACEQDCLRQEDLYAEWGDDDKAELFKEHKRCLMQATCDEIADGECFVGYEELFVFEPVALESELEEAETSPVEGSE